MRGSAATEAPSQEQARGICQARARTRQCEQRWKPRALPSGALREGRGR